MKQQILRFSEINDLFEATGFEKRTDISDFFVFGFDELPKNKGLSMPPYQKDFYQISLILEADEAAIGINEQSNKQLQNSIYFLSPEHIFSWKRRPNTAGYIIYFKLPFLNFFRGNFKLEFSFFDLTQYNSLALEASNAASLAKDFQQLHREFYTPTSYRIQILQSLLLALLFKFKSIQEAQTKHEIKRSKKQELLFQYQNLVNNTYLKDKQVQSYANQLFVSANSLNQVVKELTGKTAKQIITQTILRESKKLLQYSTDDIAEIAFQLGYEEPSHFIRFFKKQTQQTPKQYRQALL